MEEITNEMMTKWLQQAYIKAMTPTDLIISKPSEPTIKICGNDVFLTGRPMIYKVHGIEIWIDETIEIDKAYLVDRNSAVLIENIGEQ